MEKSVRKTNDVSTLEDHDTLVDGELDAVSGGFGLLVPGFPVPEPPRPTGYVKMSDIQLK
jgi:hypothetical protein